MAVNKLTCVQGASFAYDITCDEVPTFDANWTGTWAVIESLDDVTDGDDIVTLASGDLVHSPDNTILQLRIPPADNNALPVKTYVLVAQVINTAIGFSEEVLQAPYTITKQGIA